MVYLIDNHHVQTHIKSFPEDGIVTLTIMKTPAQRFPGQDAASKPDWRFLQLSSPETMREHFPRVPKLQMQPTSSCTPG